MELISLCNWYSRGSLHLSNVFFSSCQSSLEEVMQRKASTISFEMELRIHEIIMQSTRNPLFINRWVLTRNLIFIMNKTKLYPSTKGDFIWTTLRKIVLMSKYRGNKTQPWVIEVLQEQRISSVATTESRISLANWSRMDRLAVSFNSPSMAEHNQEKKGGEIENPSKKGAKTAAEDESSGSSLWYKEQNHGEITYITNLNQLWMKNPNRPKTALERTKSRKTYENEQSKQKKYKTSLS